MTDISIATDSLILSCNPLLGGSCTSLMYRERPGARPAPVLRALPEGESDPFRSACFPLVPYSNRLIDPAIADDTGALHIVPRNRSGVSTPLHGIGWELPWRLRAHTARRITLELEPIQAHAWPFPFRCIQHFSVHGNRARFDIIATNSARQAAPIGIGFHPYFPAAPYTTLQFAANFVWEQDRNGYPAAAVLPAGGFDFQHARLIQGAGLNHCYQEWNQAAIISYPRDNRRVRIVAGGQARHAVLFAPPGEPHFCFEPVSHVTGALSRGFVAGTGAVHLVRPGASLHASMTLKVEPLFHW